MIGKIKDLIAYLRVIQNPMDDISIKRIINEPKRSIGKQRWKRPRDLQGKGDKYFTIISKCR